MKALFFIGALFLFSACGGDEAVIGNRTTAEFENVYNAGKVTKGEIIKAKIKIKY